MKSVITGLEIDRLTYLINTILSSLVLVMIITFTIQAVFYNIGYYLFMWVMIYISYKFLKTTFKESIYGEIRAEIEIRLRKKA